MKRLASLLLALWIAFICFAKSALPNYEYDIVGVAIAKEGYYLVEVSALVDKKKEATIDVAKKCAILGCLFKGFAVERFFQKPIISSPSQAEEHCEYFDKLISEQFDTYTNTTQPIQIVKVGKRFRVKAIVVVAKEALRKNLENAGIVRKLGL